MKNQIIAKKSLLFIFTIFFSFQQLYTASFFSPSKWMAEYKKSPYKTAAVIGGTAIAATTLYYYIKNKFLKKSIKPSEPEKMISNEFLKHTILNETISILEEEEAKKLKNIDTQIELCIKEQAQWKIQITKQMILNIDEKIDNLIKNSKNQDDPRKNFSLERIEKYIAENKNLFEHTLLLHIPKKYQETYNQINLNDIQDNIKLEGSDYYLYVNGTENKPNINDNQNQKPKRRNIPATKPVEKNIWNLWGLFIVQDFGAQDKKNHNPENENDNRIRYGNQKITPPSNPVEVYKIHLMPKAENFIEYIKTIINSNTLKELVIAVKFRTEILKVGKTAGYECPAQANIYNPHAQCLCGNKGSYDVGPIIVIYTSKKYAQDALNAVNKLFKGKDGLNLTPQFNQKITNLIYYAQGNSISKIFNSHLFEKPDLIHYQSNIISTEFSSYGNREETKLQSRNKSHDVHHLTNPAETN